MSWSTCFLVQAAVRDILVDAGTLTDVDIRTGPRPLKAGAKNLAVADPRVTASRPTTGGSRREKGTFALIVHVELTGSGEGAIDGAREAADDVLSRAAGVLEAQYTVDGLVLTCDVTEVAEDDQSLTTDGHTYTAHATVSFTADVYPGA